MSFEEAKKLDDAYVMHTFGRSPVEFVGGSGMRLTDSDGKEYLLRSFPRVSGGDPHQRDHQQSGCCFSPRKRG